MNKLVTDIKTLEIMKIQKQIEIEALKEMINSRHIDNIKNALKEKKYSDHFGFDNNGNRILTLNNGFEYEVTFEVSISTLSSTGGSDEYGNTEDTSYDELVLNDIISIFVFDDDGTEIEPTEELLTLFKKEFE